MGLVTESRSYSARCEYGTGSWHEEVGELEDCPGHGCRRTRHGYPGSQLAIGCVSGFS